MPRCKSCTLGKNRTKLCLCLYGYFINACISENTSHTFAQFFYEYLKKHFLQISSNSEMVMLESSKIFVELTRMTLLQWESCSWMHINLFASYIITFVTRFSRSSHISDFQFLSYSSPTHYYVFTLLIGFAWISGVRIESRAGCRGQMPPFAPVVMLMSNINVTENVTKILTSNQRGYRLK